MRTTLTIDDDVATQLERIRRQRRSSLKAIVNEALRAGLHELDSGARRGQQTFRTRALTIGEPLLGNMDNIAEVLAFAEGDDFR
jgi:predicted transcriptional regulator